MTVWHCNKHICLTWLVSFGSLKIAFCKTSGAPSAVLPTLLQVTWDPHLVRGHCDRQEHRETHMALTLHFCLYELMD